MSIFDRLKNKSPEKEVGEIRGIGLKVRAGTSPLPGNFVGAYVMSFAIADDAKEAVRKTFHALAAMGYDLEEVMPEGLLIPVSGWDKYVADAWGDVTGHFPKQAEVKARLAGDGVIFGPFGAYPAS